MTVHKLNFDDFDTIDYHLIALHTSLEDYRLAYFINQKLPINLSKSNFETLIKNKEREVSFSIFGYFDTEKEISWTLIQNKNETIHLKKELTQNLFSDVVIEIETKKFLLPEFKKVDYFLKIDNSEERQSNSEIELLLNTIENVSMAYSIETTKIKSKNNLIF